MAHGYKTLQHWNQWLDKQFLGKNLLDAEQRLLSCMLNRHFGKHALLIGVPHQSELLESTTISCHSVISPLIDNDKKSTHIESDFHELPILTGSIDLVMLPHTLEFIDNPRQLLAEACRIIKPEGLIVISGFNPYSMWGIRKLFTNKKITPWSSNFIQSHTIKNWLRLADFEMEKQKSALFTPPISNKKLYGKLHAFEDIGSKCFPFFGGVYVLVARAKVIPLTPIRMKWKQQLTGIRISSSITGHIARQSK